MITQDNYTVIPSSATEYSESITSLILIGSILIPIIIALIIIIGIWRIHKSIDKQTAVQIRQAEAMEQIFFLLRNESVNHRANAHNPNVKINHETLDKPSNPSL